MSRARPIGPHARMDAYAHSKGWQATDGLERQRPMTRRQYQRWWSKYQRWMRLPVGQRSEDAT